MHWTQTALSTERSNDNETGGQGCTDQRRGQGHGRHRGANVRSGGAKVVIGDILEEEGRQTEAAINEGGGECVFVRLDVTDELAWAEAVATAVNRFGKLDILVNNAGIGIVNNVEDTTAEEWDLVMDINAKGVFLGSKAALPALREAGGGSIVNISSIARITGGRTSSYAASKGAVRLLTKSTAIQYAHDGIRCNSVHPGVIETPMTLPIMLDTEAGREQHAARHPMGRIGQPEDIAYGVLFLASDEASFMTGSELIIDGGLTAQ